MGNITDRNSSPRRLDLLLIGLMTTGKTTLLHRILNHPSAGSDGVFTYVPTIGVNVEYGKLETPDVVLSFLSWYVGGSDKIRALWKPMYSITNGLVFMVNATQVHYTNEYYRELTGLDECRKELHFLLKEPDLRDHPVLILSNWGDRPNARAPEQIRDELGLRDVISWKARGVVSFLMGTHAAAGSNSSGIHRLAGPGNAPLREHIWSFVGPLEYHVPAAVLEGRPCHVQPCSVETGEGIQEGLQWMDEAILAKAEAPPNRVTDPRSNYWGGSWETFYNTEGPPSCIETQNAGLVPRRLWNAPRRSIEDIRVRLGGGAAAGIAHLPIAFNPRGSGVAGQGVS